MRIKILCIVASMFILSSCGPSSCIPRPHYKTIKLPSGKEIKFMGILNVIVKGESPALAFRYQTDIPIDNLPGLKKEAEEIWKYFRNDVERAQHDWAVIRAEGPRKGFIITTNRSHGFIIEKDANGKWVFSENNGNNT